MADPKASDTGSAAIYGMAQSLPDRSIVDQLTRCYLDSLYTTMADKWNIAYLPYTTLYIHIDFRFYLLWSAALIIILIFETILFLFGTKMLLPVSCFYLQQKYYFFVQIYRYERDSDQICMQHALALSPNTLNFRT